MLRILLLTNKFELFIIPLPSTYLSGVLGFWGRLLTFHKQLPYRKKVASYVMSVTEKFTAIRKGLLEFLILKIISQRQGLCRRHAASDSSATEFATQEGTLYPLLSKMRREGLVDYEWQESDAGPPRKYYRLDRKGQVAAGRTERLLEGDQHHDRAAGTMTMQKVITINLNGNAYQLDESAYAALAAYLDRARAAAQGQPGPRRDRRGSRAGDRRQVQPLPQRAQDRRHRLGDSAVLTEMGPVDAPAAAERRPATARRSENRRRPRVTRRRPAPRRKSSIGSAKAT